ANVSMDLPLNWSQKMQSVWQISDAPAASLIIDNRLKYLSNPLCLGLTLLAAINLCLWITQPFAKVDPAILPATHTWAWWATQEYLSCKTAPPVVLLGSSLFMHPI